MTLLVARCGEGDMAVRLRALTKRGIGGEAASALALEAELLRKAFSEFDTERKGFIDAADLRRVLLGWGQEEATEALRTMLRCVREAHNTRQRLRRLRFARESPPSPRRGSARAVENKPVLDASRHAREPRAPCAATIRGRDAPIVGGG